MNKPFRLLLSLLSLGLLSFPGLAQGDQAPVRRLTLQEVVQKAKEQSPAYRQAITQLSNRSWQYRTFRSNYLPQLTLNGTVPDLNRGIDQVRQPDGTFRFVRVSQVNYFSQLSLSQSIGLTGGEVFVLSRLQRFDNFPSLGGRERYSANPAVIGFAQPIFAFNPLRWDRRIEPLRYEESKREYFEEMERISAIATQRFFNLLLAQISYEIAERNVANNDTLYQIAQGRYNLGKIAENELLQLELSTMNARQELAQAALDMETGTLRLKVYLGLTDDDPLRLLEPNEIPQFAVDEAKALQEARKNRARVLAFERELLQADRDLARARGESGLNVQVFGTFGLTQRANGISDLYINPDDQQRLQIGFNIPIVDWGRTKSRIGTAKANQELVQADIEQEQINFDQEIYVSVKQFKMLRNQLIIAEKAVEVGIKRFEITKSRYLIGKIGILDLNIAAQERDLARRNYVSSLRSFWDAYYNLRLLTLYDFEQNSVLLQEI